MKPISSAITGALSAVSEVLNSIGERPSEIGSAVALSPEVAAERLLAHTTPAAATAALCRSLISSCNVTVRVKREGRYPQNAAFYTVIVGCEIDQNEKSDLAKARRFANAAQAPASDVEVGAWLAQLQAATAHRPGSAADAAIQLTLYVRELQRYPADVARSACYRLMRGNGVAATNWFPTLAEIIAVADGVNAERKTICDAIAAAPSWTFTLQNAAVRDGEEGARNREAIRCMLDEYRTAAAEEVAKRPKAPPIRANHGAIGRTGLTPELRALVSAQQRDGA